MRRSWFHRLQFSYMPIFFIVISILIAIFFFSIGEITQNAAETVNRGSSAHTLKVVDTSLQSIENMIIKEMMETGGIQDFYNDLLDHKPYQQMVKPSEKLRDIVTQYSLIQSVYMLRWKDKTVLSASSTLPLDRFEDRAFVQEYFENGKGTFWTGIRPYRELLNQNKSNVVTLVKPYPLPAGDQGIVVVNVGGQALQDLVRDLFDSDFIHAVLVDREDTQLFASETGSPSLDRTMTEVQSEYTGWKIKSVILGGAIYEFASTFNWILMISGCAAIITAVVYITYISKRNYRPLASLTQRVHGYAQVKAGQLLKSGGKDEFAFLENALDEMIERSNELISQQEEHLQVRKRHWVKETLEGEYGTVSRQTWPAVSERFGWSAARTKSAVIVIEIDRYMEFCNTYSKRDQSLLKYLLGNVAAEVAQQRGMLIFGEWLHANKWCAFLQLEEGQTEEDVMGFAQLTLSWTQGNLDFHVTIGVGDAVGSAEEISMSYEQALNALQYKMTLGNNRVICHWEVLGTSVGANRRAVVDTREFTLAFKLGEPEWEVYYTRFIEALRAGAAPKEELVHQVDYLIYLLSRELSELNIDYQGIWSDGALPQLNRLLRNFDTFEELDEGMRGILGEAQGRMSALREERTYSSTMKEVRQYIADHFGNPDLSLNHLSTAFDLNPKYVSHLFREEFGEKFVDYLANVRMEKAKELLASTTLSIQDVAMQVGYMHPFSFIRVFKKSVGMTPGDYRKQASVRAE